MADIKTCGIQLTIDDVERVSGGVVELALKYRFVDAKNRCLFHTGSGLSREAAEAVKISVCAIDLLIRRGHQPVADSFMWTLYA